MKFALAMLVFALFAFFISWGVLLMLRGEPWLLICAMLIFLGTFTKYGCQTDVYKRQLKTAGRFFLKRRQAC